MFLSMNEEVMNEKDHDKAFEFGKYKFHKYFKEF
jgi:hypothetical protein